MNDRFKDIINTLKSNILYIKSFIHVLCLIIDVGLIFTCINQLVKGKIPCIDFFGVMFFVLVLSSSALIACVDLYKKEK